MFQDLKPYPEYVEAKEPWLGSIPASWETRRFRYLLSETDARSTTGEEQLLRVSQYTGVTERRGNGGAPDTRAASLVGYKLVEANQLAVNIMLAWNGSLGVSRFRGIVSPAYCVYAVGPDLDPWYLHHLLRSPVYKDRIRVESRGIVESRLRLYTDDLNRLLGLVPPIDEQRAIVKYLAHAHQRINEAIATKRRSAALLAELEQANLNGLFATGGHSWPRVPFKRVVGFQEGPGIMAADFRESGVPLLRIASMVAEEVDLAGVNYLDPDAVEKRWSHFRVRPGDYLLSASGSTGVVKPVSAAAYGAIPYTGLIRLWPRTPDIDMEYIRWFMRSPEFIEQMDLFKSGVGIEHFGPTHLKRMWVPVPPLGAQRAAVDAFVRERARIQEQISHVEAEIDLLQEFKTRLTADVVTGQVDVRSVAANLPSIGLGDVFDAAAGAVGTEDDEMADAADVEDE